MNWKIWLAFGLGLIFGVFGMATFVGCLMLRADELRKKKLPKIIMGYFVTTDDKEKRYGVLN